MGVYYTGTLSRRRGGPDLLNSKKISQAPKKMLIPFNQNHVNCYIYIDAKIVGFMTTFFQIREDEISETKEIF